MALRSPSERRDLHVVVDDAAYLQRQMLEKGVGAFAIRYVLSLDVVLGADQSSAQIHSLALIRVGSCLVLALLGGHAGGRVVWVRLCSR
jgi:hypothetical protein